jgi:single-stranded-DNA-specific exonuclease
VIERRLSLTGCRWSIKEADEAALAILCRYLDLTRLTARALLCRGVTSPEEARCFLSHDLEGVIDPGRMKDMGEAVAAVERAIASGALIRIYGDYDVDGVCATAMLVRALGGLGANVDWYIPHRIDEGYGVNEEAVRQAHAEGVGLLITVDCGSTAVKEVTLARELGMEVVVTDHHQPHAEMPPAPTLNPWRPDCAYPFKELAGVGVAFKLVSAIARARGLPEGAEYRFLDLVCLGTVGDVVPLLGENRLFVRHGLLRMPKSKKVGVLALLAASRVSGEVGARQVAFGLAPRINAAGRMEHAQAAVELLLTQDSAEAKRLAAGLCEQNDRRRAEEQQTLEQAEEMVAREVDLSREKVLVLASEGWHPGVIGIVASRLVERYHRPALLVALSDGMGKGSGRSIAALNLWEALQECAPVLTRFGGHRFAAGFGIEAARVDELRRRVNEVADSRLTMDDLVREIAGDAEAQVSELTIDAVSELNQLEPCGMGNPTPLLITRGLRVTEVTQLSGGLHLSLRLREESGQVMEAIWWGRGAMAEKLSPGDLVDVCHRPRVDEWNGNVRVRMIVEDVRVEEAEGTGNGKVTADKRG